MMIVAKFWQLLERHGYQVREARLRLDPKLEKVIEEEMEEEEAHGEKEPEVVPDYPAGVRLIRKGKSQCLLYASESVFDKGPWGVGVETVAELRGQPLRWALVLFRTSGAGGFWFDGKLVTKLAGQWKRIIPNGPNYQIREPDEIAGATAFASTDELLQLVERLHS
jgi:hypothetical protein